MVPDFISEDRSTIKMFNCNCLDYMMSLPDNYFNLSICDPPYGFMKSDNLNFRYKKIYENIAPNKEYFIELERISKNMIIWGANYFTSFLKPTLSWLCWDKGQPLETFSDCELAWTSFEQLTKMIRLHSYGFNHADKRHGNGSTIHPTQKPVALYKWLLKNYAKEGDKIFDSHGGSGSICIACHDMKFDLDWCELDKEYFEAAKKRFENHKKQLTLF